MTVCSLLISSHSRRCHLLAVGTPSAPFVRVVFGRCGELGSSCSSSQQHNKSKTNIKLHMTSNAKKFCYALCIDAHDSSLYNEAIIMARHPLKAYLRFVEPSGIKRFFSGVVFHLILKLTSKRSCEWHRLIFHRKYIITTFRFLPLAPPLSELNRNDGLTAHKHHVGLLLPNNG
mgnify:CR=1 FL=1